MSYGSDRSVDWCEGTFVQYDVPFSVLHVCKLRVHPRAPY
jgi:hypothetical protein